MRLFALIKQFNQCDNCSSPILQSINTYLTEYSTPNEADDYINIYNYHCKVFQKAKYSNKRLSLFSVKASIILEGIARELPKLTRVHLLATIVDILSISSSLNAVSFDLVKTIGAFFRMTDEEVNDIILFFNTDSKYEGRNIVVVSSSFVNPKGRLHQEEPLLTGSLHILFNRKTGGVFIRPIGEQEVFIKDGNVIKPQRIYLINKGAIIENFKINPLYYGDILAKFNDDHKSQKLIFEANNLSYTFPDGVTAIHPLAFKFETGQMVGVLGNSGSGKTTLLNLLVGNHNPTTGTIMLNGYKWDSLKDDHYPYVGLIPQDDQLIKELTVFQNLYFTVRLCFQDLTPFQAKKLSVKTLDNLGLGSVKKLKVGTPEKSIISGGQRKRLNMALELIREPKILFVDEPTSGLSSSDSERIVHIIKQQVQQGKLAVVNIHQPSSSVFKLFDKILLLDQGGRPVYLGNPIDAIHYLKSATSQVSIGERECQFCGNINPDLMFEIIEQKKLKYDGMPTEYRKFSPDYWYKRFTENSAGNNQETKPKGELPEQNQKKTNFIRQTSIFLKRNFLSMFADKQFLAISTLQAPLLGFILAYLAKNFGNPSQPGGYSFYYNQNIPAFMLIAVIVAMFFGLMIGAERIIRDKSIIEREKFLGLSRFSYINSKLVCLVLFLVFQVTTFMLVSNLILEIRGVNINMWIILFSIALNAGLLSLNLSSGLRSTVAIYISIPILLMPQLLLNGSLIPFDKLHKDIASQAAVPIIGNLAISRWSYEALLVNHFANNPYQKQFMDIDIRESQLQYFQGYLIPKLEQVTRDAARKMEMGDTLTFKNHCDKLFIGIEAFGRPKQIENSIAKFTSNIYYKDTLLQQLNSLQRVISSELREVTQKKNTQSLIMADQLGGTNALVEMKHKYANETVSDILLARDIPTKIIETQNGFIRNFEPVFNMPESQLGNAHFYSPVKNFMGWRITTPWFNIIVVWLISLVLYISLYYDWLKKLINLFLRKR